jgi:protein-S-isoprenylcysteine O-methyltransferase Ste14
LARLAHGFRRAERQRAGHLLVIDPELVAWGSLALPFAFRLVVVVAIAGSLPLTAMGALRGYFLDAGGCRGAASADAGCLARIRHRLSAAFSCSLLGYALVTANWAVAIAGLDDWIAVLARVPKEEAMMFDAFADEDRPHVSRTGRQLPRFGAR